jgi:hypothetical protein
MSDRELIRLAAKAAEVNGPQVQGFDGIVIGNERDGHIFWNPLKDDGDALRLAVKLNMSLVMFSIYVRVDTVDYEDIYEEYGDDPYAATRRAIVRAAAEIGKQQEKNNGN